MRLLLIEDDKKLSLAVCYWLTKNQYDVDACFDGDESSYYINEGNYDCILLDRMLPGKDGIQILKDLRTSHNNTPVILITALDALQDKITGLNCGADDYLVKPFEFEELEARIRCVTRRRLQDVSVCCIAYGDISYEPESLCLSGPSSSLILSKKEGRVIETFILSQGRTLSRESILTNVWGLDSDIEATNLDNYIYFLRRRLKTIGSSMKLSNVWGLGYRMEAVDGRRHV